MLRLVQPNKQVSSVLKWEGIVIDPVGAVMALLVTLVAVAAVAAVAVVPAATELGKFPNATPGAVSPVAVVAADAPPTEHSAARAAE